MPKLEQRAASQRNRGTGLYDRFMDDSSVEGDGVDTQAELRAVIFDYGGVLSLVPTPPDWENLARAARIPLAVLQSGYWKFREEYDCAVFGGVTYWRRIVGAAGQTLTDNEAAQLIALDNLQWLKENWPAIKLAASLRAMEVKTAILSNMQFEMLTGMRAKFSWLEQFDRQLYSCELGISKPDPEIFRHAVKLLKVNPAEALFLDDREENLEGAARVGLRTMQYEAPGSQAALENLLGCLGLNLHSGPSRCAGAS
jgi:putative hydrolase of the HAD superfamily